MSSLSDTVKCSATLLMLQKKAIHRPAKKYELVVWASTEKNIN